MKSSEHEQLTDELIGEAVLSLLQDNGPINTLSLIARLQTMKSNERERQRQEMLSRLIDEISHSHITPAGEEEGVKQHEWNGDSGDNVYPLFGDRQRQGRSKKH
ncbi:hypothetical protein KXR87_17140 [Yokenella regensburgei]|uniref:hypothetical protein n=1 Tax=Yokenella regensburgei TaxID=158877 RepID=UPI003F166C07